MVIVSKKKIILWALPDKCIPQLEKIYMHKYAYAYDMLMCGAVGLVCGSRCINIWFVLPTQQVHLSMRTSQP